MRTIQLGSLTSLTFATMICCGCGFNVKPVDPPPCQTAMACITQEVAKDPTCIYRKYGADGTGYRFRNSHPNKTVILSYEESVRHMNSNPRLPDESGPHIAKIDPSGGLENPVGAGCWRTQGPQGVEQYDEWSYNKTTACFADECNKKPPPTNKPVDNRDPKSTCEAVCDNNDKSCFKTVVPKGTPITDVLSRQLDNVTFKFLNTSGSETIDMRPLAALVNQANGNSACWRTDAFIGAASGGAYSFSNAGASCRVNFKLTGEPNFVGFGIELPGSWLGSLTKSSGVYELASRDAAHSPLLSVLKSGANSEEFDAIAKITGKRGQMTFTGEKYYCGQLNWNAQGDKVSRGQKR